MNSTEYHFTNGLVELYYLLPEVKVRALPFAKKAKEVLLDCFDYGGKVLVCGNGGSACDAMHFAEELTGRFRKDRKALPAISLTDPAHMTCVGNDYGFEYVFSRAVEALGKPEDVLVAISTSGNSKNIMLAVEQAKGKGMKTICLLGKDGGRIKGMGDVELIVPSKTTERVQEVHMLVLHLLIEAVEREMFPENYQNEKVTPTRGMMGAK